MEIFEELVFQRNLILSYISTLIKLKNKGNFEQAYIKFKSRTHYEKLDVEIFEVAYKFDKMEKNELEKQLDKFITNKNR